MSKNDKFSIEDIANNIFSSAKKLYKHKFNIPNIKKLAEDLNREPTQAELDKLEKYEKNRKQEQVDAWKNWQLSSKISWCLFWYCIFYIPSLFITFTLVFIVSLISLEAYEQFSRYILSDLLGLWHYQSISPIIIYNIIINYFVTIRIIKWSL